MRVVDRPIHRWWGWGGQCVCTGRDEGSKVGGKRKREEAICSSPKLSALSLVPTCYPASFAANGISTGTTGTLDTALSFRFNKRSQRTPTERPTNPTFDPILTNGSGFVNS